MVFFTENSSTLHPIECAPIHSDILSVSNVVRRHCTHEHSVFIQKLCSKNAKWKDGEKKIYWRFILKKKHATCRNCHGHRATSIRSRLYTFLPWIILTQPTRHSLYTVLYTLVFSRFADIRYTPLDTCVAQRSNARAVINKSIDDEVADASAFFPYVLLLFFFMRLAQHIVRSSRSISLIKRDLCLGWNEHK